MASPDDDEAPGAPPEPDTVALRALAAAGLLRRLALEQRPPDAAAHAALNTWLEQNGLFSNFGPEGFALFSAEPGSWSQEDKDAAAWGAEELVMLAWALGLAEPPSPMQRAAVAPLLAALPHLGPAEPFSLAAKLKPLEAMETARALYETLAIAARTEAWARAVAADPTLASDDDELSEVLAAVKEDGFPLEAVTVEKGAQAAAVQALRTVSQKLVDDLFGPGTPHKAAAFAGQALAALEDEPLAVFLATAQLREQALAWLTEGDAWEARGAAP